MVETNVCLLQVLSFEDAPLCSPDRKLKPIPNLDGNDSTESSGSDGDEAPISQVYYSSRQTDTASSTTASAETAAKANYEALMKAARDLEPPQKAVRTKPRISDAFLPQPYDEDVAIQLAVAASLQDVQAPGAQAETSDTQGFATCDSDLMPPPPPPTADKFRFRRARSTAPSTTTSDPPDGENLLDNTVEAEAQAQILAEAQLGDDCILTQLDGPASAGAPDDVAESDDMFEDVSEVDSNGESDSSDFPENSSGDDTDYEDDEDIRNHIAGVSPAERRRAMDDVILAPIPKRARESAKRPDLPEKEEVSTLQRTYVRTYV